MKFILGMIIGLFLAIAIAWGAAHYAFGGAGGDWDFGDRDRSNDVSQTYDFADFDRIEIGGIYELDVEVGGDFAIELTGHPDDMARVEIESDNGELVLDQKKRGGNKRRWRHRGVQVEITMPELAAIDISGVVDGDVSGISADEFEARLSGVGDLDLEGSCTTFVVRVSGVGDLDARDLECENVDIRVSGIGDASVYASEAVDASVSGIGSVSVYGSPAQVEKSGTFLSKVNIK